MQITPDIKTIGVIANPYSSRDIRRLISSATSIQTVERANIIERIIVTLGTFGIDKVIMMPDNSGIFTHLHRNLNQKRRIFSSIQIPELEILDMPVTGTAVDSEIASQMLKARNVNAVAVLGGDGTHRVVSKHIGEIPLASISTGTNNAFPKFYEATLVGMALGIHAASLVPANKILHRNKSIHVTVNHDVHDIALVDLAITSDQWVGARAVWHMENLKELYLAFCEPGAIGMSAIGGLLNRVSRNEPAGLKIVTSDPEICEQTVNAPIAPGLFSEIGIKSSNKIALDVPCRIETVKGVIALDGEREIEFSEKDDVFVELKNDGPVTIDIDAAILHASSQGDFVSNKQKKNNFGENSFQHEREWLIQPAI